MFGLFGHRHAAPTLSDRIAATFAHVVAYLHTVPPGIWIAIIGAAAAIAGSVLSERSAARREAKLAARSDKRVAARVRADLLVRLRAHCRRLQAAIDADTIDVAAWRAAHDDLLRRAREADVIDALGRDYVAFMETVHREGLAIDGIRARGARDAADVVKSYQPYLNAFALTNTTAIPRVSRA